MQDRTGQSVNLTQGIYACDESFASFFPFVLNKDMSFGHVQRHTPTSSFSLCLERGFTWVASCDELDPDLTVFGWRFKMVGFSSL